MSLSGRPTFANGDDVERSLVFLSVSQIFEAGRPHIFGYRDRRNRGHLLDTVATLPLDVQDRIRAAGDAAEARAGPRSRKRRRVVIEPPTELAPPPPNDNHFTPGSYLAPPDDSTSRFAIANFIDSTSNDALSQSICAACAREQFTSSMTIKAVLSIPHSNLLRTGFPHPAQGLTNGMLLQPAGLFDDGTKAYLCKKCIGSLLRAEQPRLSLANNMWLGEVPFVLAVLTLPERVLIAKSIPSVYIVKLYPKKQGSYNWNPRSMYDGFQGNVASFALPSKDLADLVSGTILPPPAAVLSSVFGVTIVGPRNLPERSLPGFLKVNRERLHAALLWLKDNNPLYREVDISEARLHELPIDDVPIEIMAVTRHTEDVSSTSRETGAYVPTDDDGSAVRPPAGIIAIDEDEESIVRDHVVDRENAEPSVLPLHALGVVDASGVCIPDGSLLAHALRNASQTELQRAAAVRTGNFVNEYGRTDEHGVPTEGLASDPNHLLGCFPHLFPYGRGGFEVYRTHVVSYEQHAKWALQYSDKRFRKDPLFMFQVFGVLQKRQVCRSASLQIKRSAFVRHQSAIRSLKPRDLVIAAEEEARKVPFSNPAVRALRENISAVRKKVVGTDESKIQLRAQAWSMAAVMGPPALWLTINPPDSSDPIAQVLTGEDIDLDDFADRAGPTADERAVNVAQDPYAAALYFQTIIGAILEHVFGIKVNHVTKRIDRNACIFGEVAAYLAGNEAQGRGTIHAHLVLYLLGAPTTAEMNTMLQSPAFREQLARFIKANICSHIPGLSGAESVRLQRQQEVSYSRPPDPREPDFEVRRAEMEKRLMRALQFHSCDQGGCKETPNAPCKRGAPWDLSNRDFVDDDGVWGSKRLYGYVNAANPTILVCGRCNGDIKLITNGVEAKDIMWYITGYYSKGRKSTTNASALLARRLAFHTASERYNSDLLQTNKRLIERCSNTLTRQVEYGAPEVVNYIMGWGDRFVSHHFVPVHWYAVTSALHRAFPCVRPAEPFPMFTRPSVQDPPSASGGQELDEVPFQLVQDTLLLKDDLRDYSVRGSELERYNLLDFLVNTYESSRPLKQDDERSSAGRPANTRVFYLPTSERKSSYRVIRSKGHETMPQFVGKWFPKRDLSDELYSASVLALLTPWRQLDHLKGDTETFCAKLLAFESIASPSTIRFIHNLDYYHEACSSAARKRAGKQRQTDETVVDDEDEQEHGTHDDVGRLSFDAAQFATEDDALAAAADARANERDRVYSNVALSIGRDVGFLPPEPDEDSGIRPLVTASRAPVATGRDRDQFERWGTEISRISRTVPTLAPDPSDRISLVESPLLEPIPDPSVTLVDPPSASFPPIDRGILNDDQRIAFDIVDKHIRATLDNRNPKQLLMVVHGAGGTGKSVLVNAIAANFDHLEARSRLAVTATTGCAACLIGGTTLHNWAGLGVRGPTNWSPVWPSRGDAQVVRRRRDNILGTGYLVVDEMSFGGLNVILIGDFHQFPPVAHPTAALYQQNPSSPLGIQGRNLYLQFDTMVRLEEQMRIVDRRWMELLSRLREGACTEDDIREVRKLVLTHSSCDVPDFNDISWKSAAIVTPRHSVREPWNSLCLEKETAQSGQIRYIFRAEDTIGRQREPLRFDEKLALAGLNDRKTGKLSEYVELAVGSVVMVTTNTATEADLANGVRGTVDSILLDPRDADADVDDYGLCRLAYPPSMVMFKPDKCTFRPLENLCEGLIPLFPVERTFQVSIGKSSRSIRRRQYALMPGYGFTDYKSQGQTIPYVLVDIGKTPGGGLTPFSVYVALSRSRGRDSIRLLREFEDALFTTHPCEALRDEDIRINAIVLQTKQRLLEGYYD